MAGSPGIFKYVLCLCHSGQEVTRACQLFQFAIETTLIFLRRSGFSPTCRVKTRPTKMHFLLRIGITIAAVVYCSLKSCRKQSPGQAERVMPCLCNSVPMHSVPMRHIGYNPAFSKSPRLMLNNYFWNILTGQYI